MTSVKEMLMCRLADVPSTGGNKITIVGAGRVGMACAICILSKKISNEICLIDVDENKVKSEILDLQHGSSFLNNAKITGGSDFAASANSKVYIITAAADAVPRSERKSRLDLLECNAEVIKEVIPKLVKVSPESIILMITNPVDILTYLAWRISGFPWHRVIGSGTTLDSARFRFLISERLNIAPSSCEARIIGEHGDSCVAVWSGVSVSGIKLRELAPDIGLSEDSEHWNELRTEVVDASKKVVHGKGYTNWAIALSCAAIVEAILSNSGAIMLVSTAIKGMYNIEKNVFLSMPCVLNANGITSVVKLNLTPYEVEMLQQSANVLSNAQSRIGL